MQRSTRQLIDPSVRSSNLLYCRPRLSDVARISSLISQAVEPGAFRKKSRGEGRCFAVPPTVLPGACKDSPLYHQVLEAAGDNLTGTTWDEYYDPRMLDICLSQALKDFDKTARRYKITREGLVIQSTFPASNPPNRYPSFLMSDCDWRDGNVQIVYHVQDGLMVHTRCAFISPFYPRLQVLPMNDNLGIKPLGIFNALGAMWHEYQSNEVMSHVTRLGLLHRDNCDIILRILDELPDLCSQHSSAKRIHEVITVSVSPYVFTWDVSDVQETRKILVVDCKEQWDAVEAVFGVPGEPYEHPLDWDRFAKNYAGIDIRVGEANKLSDAPVWLVAWDVIGPCIWDLAAVEAEFEVRTCGSWNAAYAWIKLQEAKATSLQVLLDNGTGETDSDDVMEALVRAELTYSLRVTRWRQSMLREALEAMGPPKQMTAKKHPANAKSKPNKRSKRRG